VLKARSRKISLVLVLAMLMTMFAGLGVASAATGYSATHVPIVPADDKAHDLGAVMVSFDNLPAKRVNQFIIKLPANFKYSATTFTSNPADYKDAAGLGLTGIVAAHVYGVQLANASIIKPDPTSVDFKVYALYDAVGGSNQANILVLNNTGGIIPEVKFALNLNNVTVPVGAPEAINATLIEQPGSVFADGIVQVAKTAGGALTALAGDAITVTGAGGSGATIYFRENKAGALKDVNSSLTLKLPKGFEWAAGSVFVTMDQTTGSITPVKDDARTLVINRTKGYKTSDPYIWVLKSNIIVDESVAEFGDIEVTIGGASSVSPSSVIIGIYADYGVEVVVKEPEKELLAGRTEQYVSDFKFQELLGDSLLPGRTIYVELPDGVKWVKDKDWNWEKNGGVTYDGDKGTIVNNKPELLKIVVKDVDKTKGALEINRAQVDIAGNFTGDITAKIWGSAGISEEIVLGKVVAPISVTADVKDVKIGLQKQVAGNIVITETKAEAIDSYVYGVSNPSLQVELPFNVYWGNIPTVKVIEGDIELGTVSIEKQTLNIPIKTSSSKVSKIEISDITYTVDRTVPEGDMEATFAGDAIVQSKFANRDYVVEEVLANCVTPAPGETIGSGEFRIGSNIYYEGGVAKVMDVAPYIKNDRTYVPMRYLGEILGAEVVWDDAARTVTLTKGDITAVFTIGSTSYTVNGEAKTADVAPEIANDRTMLPARFVAEAFGAVVGWDAATQTVLIQK
jgi:hypothetical protein